MCSTKIVFLNLIFYLEFMVFTSSELIPYQSKQTFNYENEIITNSIKYSTKPFGYKIENQLSVASVWNGDNRTQILHFKFIDKFKFSTRSTSTNNENDVNDNVEYKLQNLPLTSKYAQEQEFYGILVNDAIIKILVKPSNDVSMMNLQKGIASLFQFRFMMDGITSEKDALGDCNVLYEASTSTKYKKIKKDCSNWYLKMHLREEVPLDVKVNSIQEIDYILNQEQHLNKLHSIEKHSIFIPIKTDVGSEIESRIELIHVSSSIQDIIQIKADNLKDALNHFTDTDYEEIEIESEIDGSVSMEKEGLKKLIKLYQSHLTDDKIATYKMSEIFLKLLPIARITNKKEFSQILKAHSTQNIRKSLLDLLAMTQTDDAHSSVMEQLQIDNDEHFEQLERYLQSLSVGTRPQLSIIQDLYKRLTKKSIDNLKLFDTMLQTAAALSGKYSKTTLKRYDEPVIKAVRGFIFLKLKGCEPADCNIYIRSLQNLRDPSTIPDLIEIVQKDDVTNSVAAMKALKSFPIQHFDDKIHSILEKIFYQLTKKFDSTVRTLALDIILDMKPTKEQLTKLILYLASNDKSFEVKTYLLQKITMLSEKCPKFAALVQEILKERPEVNNYNIIAQKGITTALYRPLSKTPSFNETLYSFQESYKGVLKQGTVDIRLEAGREESSTFSLGLYTRGLSSFVGGDSSSSNAIEETEEENDDTETSAGMEIFAQGIQFRPLIFFNGHSELMGHVWSGTASDPTTAYQATILLQDHEEYLLLQNGVTVYVRVLGAQSIDLNGLVTLSIWNRNAHTEINQNTGIAIDGSVTIATSFIREQNEFHISNEPKINLIADCDFYLDVMMCLQLNRPETILKHRIIKKEQIIEQNNLVKKSISITNKLTGNTLALNRKNNEMCNRIFS